jgi:hypothetical protein
VTGARQPLGVAGIAALLLFAACGSASPPGEITMVLASYEVPFEVEGERFEVSIDAPADLPEREAAAARTTDGPLRVGLVFHGVESPRSAGYYDVYAGLPAGADPGRANPKSPYHLGTLAPFGPVSGPDATGGAIAAPAQVSYDLTDLVKRLDAEGRWDGSLRLTFVHRTLEGGLEPPTEAPADAGPIRVDVVRIVRWRG